VQAGNGADLEAHPGDIDNFAQIDGRQFAAGSSQSRVNRANRSLAPVPPITMPVSQSATSVVDLLSQADQKF
jgi:hypothetical protein